MLALRLPYASANKVSAVEGSTKNIERPSERRLAGRAVEMFSHMHVIQAPIFNPPERRSVGRARRIFLLRSLSYSLLRSSNSSLRDAAAFVNFSITSS